MPLNLFGNKFSPKKTPPRRAQSLSNLHLDSTQSQQEFGLDLNNVKLNLGGNEVMFEDGMWIQENSGSAGGGASHYEVTRLRKQNQQILEENNFLKLKMDILLDMLAETSAISNLHDNELKNLRGKKR